MARNPQATGAQDRSRDRRGHLALRTAYGVYPDVAEECQYIGRAYFARSPGSDIWVDFGDLPDEVREALWQRHKFKLAFPAGLEALFGWMGR
jgi:hypothetical protein